MQLIQVASLDEKCRAEENLKSGKKKKEDKNMAKKEYTLENFTMESVMKEATGEWSNDIFSGEKCWNINYSDILTFLIQKAGTICKYHASDLFISWSSLENKMKQDGEEYAGGKYLFGFRESGVDHDNYVLSRLNNYGVEGLKRDVKELYVLEVSIKKSDVYYMGDEIKMQFGKIDMDSLGK